MRILLLASAYNSLTQRVHTKLADRGHDVPVELALSDEVMRAAAHRHRPDLVIAPMLTKAIPADIWSAWPCFIVHPGPRGDRGPSSLDWAIMNGAGRWGVTVLQANAEMDAGDIWASAEFTVPACSKSSLYRTEVADAAVPAVLAAVTRFANGGYRPEPLDYRRPEVTGRLRPSCRQANRRIDWQAEPTASVVANCGPPTPGLASWNTTGQLTVAAIAGNAAAGGLMLALAADQVWCRDGAVLNPHYRLMGLHGSEYWTYTLPRRVGAEQAARFTDDCLPISPVSALRCGLVDRVISGSVASYHTQVTTLASQLAHSPDHSQRMAAKARQLAEAKRSSRWPLTARPNWPS